MRRYRGTPMVWVLGLAAAAACGAGEESAETAEPVQGEVGGLSREQIEASAAAMDPATAESLGIVDTTIRVESPMPAESVLAVPLTNDSAPPPR